MLKVLGPLCGALLVLLILVVPLGMGATEVGRVVENAGHAPLFACVAAALWGWHRRFYNAPSIRGQYRNAAIAALMLGAISELLQAATGWRDGSWEDLAHDVVGIVAGLSLCAWTDERLQLSVYARRVCVALWGAAIVFVLAPIAATGLHYFIRWEQFPELVTWQSAAGSHFLKANDAKVQIVSNASIKQLGCASALEIHPITEGAWPGVTLEEPYRDWTRYSRLEWQVINPNAQNMAVITRIDDRKHRGDFTDRYNERFTLVPGLNTIEIPLARIQGAPSTRQLDLSNIARVILFENGQANPQPFYLCSLRLVG